MSDAYNVRTDGQRYWVYRLDGNVAVGSYETGAEAQRAAAIMNQQHNERFGKKKEASPEPSPADWVGKQLNQVSVPSEKEVTKAAAEQGAVPKKSDAPNPPPGQGASY